jgi:hypothetical protein
LWPSFDAIGSRKVQPVSHRSSLSQ